MLYLKHPNIRNPIIYSDDYRDNGFVPFSVSWNNNSVPQAHTLDLSRYDKTEYITPHYSQKANRVDIYYMIPYSEFAISGKAY